MVQDGTQRFQVGQGVGGRGRVADRSLKSFCDGSGLVAQSCPTISNCSPPGSSVHGILQARILQQVAIPSSRGSSQPRDQPRSPTRQMVSFIGRWVLYHWATRQAERQAFYVKTAACPLWLSVAGMGHAPSDDEVASVKADQSWWGGHCVQTHCPPHIQGQPMVLWRLFLVTTTKGKEQGYSTVSWRSSQTDSWPGLCLLTSSGSWQATFHMDWSTTLPLLSTAACKELSKGGPGRCWLPRPG